MMRRRRNMRWAAISAAILALAAAGCGGSGNHGPLVATVAGIPDGEVTQAQFQHQVEVELGKARVARANAPDPPTYRHCIAAARQELGGAEAQYAGRFNKIKTAQLRAGCRGDYQSLRAAALQYLIENVWIRHEATDRRLSVNDADLARQRSQDLRIFGITNFDQYSKRTGMTPDDFQQQVRGHALALKIGKQATAHLLTPTADQIAAYRARHPKPFLGPEKRDILMVLAATQAGAQQALRRLNDGASFAAVAKASSIDAATREQSGLLRGYVIGSSPDQAFDGNIARAPRGQLVGPVATGRGYLVFKVTRIVPGRPLPAGQAIAEARTLLLAAERKRVLSGLMARIHGEWAPRTTCLSALHVADCRTVAPRGKNPAPTAG